VSIFAESVVEEAALDWFRELGYTVVAGPDMAPEAGTEARASYGE
jgi:type I restriction enzyme R subunit